MKAESTERSEEPELDRPQPYEGFDGFDPDGELDDREPPPFRGFTRDRMALFLCVVLALVLLAVVPPLVNVGRYRRQIAASIGLSLGRPVHIDQVTLTLLPLPGFTLQNFVVDEDPAFGSEPVIRANEVTARLRIRSLWRRRVEFSRISLTDPSVNLVHLPDGRWNLESILLQASRMPAAPTAQKGAGDAPRFPYIEATGARVNVKMGLEKMPLSLTDADFALWLPEPRQWRVRLKAHPTRTDGPAIDTGLLRVDGTLGQAGTLAGVPVDLHGEWSDAPLGAVSRILMGRDAGLRGQMTLTATVRGTMGENRVESRLELRDVRRADFVPARTLDAGVVCSAKATRLFHTLDGLRCQWPVGSDATGLELTGEIPEVFRPETAILQARLTQIPASALLDALKVASDGISPALRTGGTLDGDLTCCAVSQAEPDGGLSGTFSIAKGRLALGDESPLFEGQLQGSVAGQQLGIQPVPLALGGKAPAILDLHISSTGVRVTLAGQVLRSRLLAFAKALPVFGNGLEQVLPEIAAPAPAALPANPGAEPVNLIGESVWGGKIVWSLGAPTKPAPQRGRGRRRRSIPQSSAPNPH